MATAWDIAPSGIEPLLEPLRRAVVRRSPGMAAALDPRQALDRARSWAARTEPGAVVDDVRVGSVLYRPDGGCTMRYSVRLAPPGRERLLLVEVPSSAQGIVLRAFPDDPGLPTLRRALDPVLMRAVLGRVVPGTGGERGIGRCTAEVVHYPRRGRCVLRYRLSLGAGGSGELRHPVLFGKVYGDDTAGTAASGLRLLRRGLRLLPDGGRVAVPEPLAVVPRLRLGLVSEVPGRPLVPDLLKAACDAGAPLSASPALRDAVVTAARTLAAVHLCDFSGTPLPVRDAAGERAAVAAELDRLDPVWPEVAARLRGGLPDGDAGPWDSVLAHGDFTPGQVLLDASGRAALVDVDTLCVAEPALDLGRFLAYLHVTGVRRSRSAMPLLAELTAVFLEAYRDARGGAPLPARTAAHRRWALARIGASACWQLKDERLRAVLDVIDAGDEWLRSGTR
jgi:hypothetical protein